MSARFPSNPYNFKRAIKYLDFSDWSLKMDFIVALNQWQTLYCHWRLVLGRDPFKAFRM